MPRREADRQPGWFPPLLAVPSAGAAAIRSRRDRFAYGNAGLNVCAVDMAPAAAEIDLQWAGTGDSHELHGGTMNSSYCPTFTQQCGGDGKYMRSHIVDDAVDECRVAVVVHRPWPSAWDVAAVRPLRQRSQACQWVAANHGWRSCRPWCQRCRTTSSGSSPGWILGFLSSAEIDSTCTASPPLRVSIRSWVPQAGRRGRRHTCGTTAVRNEQGTERQGSTGGYRHSQRHCCEADGGSDCAAVAARSSSGQQRTAQSRRAATTIITASGRGRLAASIEYMSNGYQCVSPRGTI
eukprot:SAG31_NODE_3550_length_4134_cov_2.853532_2_plen_293_part_00